MISRERIRRTRTTLFRILNTIGTARVQQGYSAFMDSQPDGIGGCFAARCVGPKYSFAREWFELPTHGGYIPLLADKLSITSGDALWLIKCFDRSPNLMRRLTEKWLVSAKS